MEKEPYFRSANHWWRDKTRKACPGPGCFLSSVNETDQHADAGTAPCFSENLRYSERRDRGAWGRGGRAWGPVMRGLGQGRMEPSLLFKPPPPCSGAVGAQLECNGASRACVETRNDGWILPVRAVGLFVLPLPPHTPLL